MDFYASILIVRAHRLQSLADSLDPTELRDRQKRMMAGGGAASRQMLRTHKASARSLLGLRVLVQNRRKDKTPILVFGSRAQVLSQPSLTSAVLRGTAEGDNLVKFMRDKSVASGRVFSTVQ